MIINIPDSFGKVFIIILLAMLKLSFGLAQLTVKVAQYPDNTPHDATIFIVGDFNDWDPGDDKYIMTLQPDSSFAYTFPAGMDTFEYKITRGNWSSVEGRANGRAIHNRIYIPSGKEKEEISITIKSWEDLAGDMVSLYSFLLLFSSFQGLLLILAINGIQEKNISANRILSVLILLISFALVGRVSTYDREIFQWQPKLILVPEMILFVYGPVFYFYIRKLLKLEPVKQKDLILSFLPAIIHIIAYLPLFFREKQVFIDQVVDETIHSTFAIVGGLALVFNAYYWYRVWKMLISHAEETSRTQSFEQNLQYLNAVMGLNAVCLVLWLFIYLISAVGFVFDIDLILIRERSTDILWVIFSFTTYFLGYFAMNQPEIFKLPKTTEKYKDSPVSKDEMDYYKKKLDFLMEEKQTFMNPELTLAELADLAETSTHTLSRVINEGYGKSFYDYINTYRVEEFTRLAISEESKNETFLALALRVGFNSKTTFNRAFKKVTGTTPRAYLKSQASEGVPVS